MSVTLQENLFTGPIAGEYDLLRLMCPNAATLARQIGEFIGAWRPGQTLKGFEIGCGTGICTLGLLAARDNLNLTAVDSAPQMLNQARVNLTNEIKTGRLLLLEKDALSALQSLPDASIDFVASNYAIHNFDEDYRLRTLSEVFRILRPGGILINGDRYANDDLDAHLADTQNIVRGWFRLFRQIDRLDLLEDWIVHLISDESPKIIMYYTPSLEQLRQIGFADISVDFREGVDTLVRATKPLDA
jgi:tRNA (cmo5U34)-methyltransferase